MFSMSFDGHGNFLSRHLDTLHTTAASLGAVGYHGPWQADLAREMPWMRAQEQSFARHPKTKRNLYVEANNDKKVLARVSDQSSASGASKRPGIRFKLPAEDQSLSHGTL
jgi:hypothetical protein